MKRGRPKVRGKKVVNYSLKLETIEAIKALVVVTDRQRNTQGKVIDETFQAKP